MIFQTYSPTHTQLRMLDSNSSGNLSAVFRLEGTIDETLLATAIQTVIHQTTTFSQRFLRVQESLQILISPEPPEGLTFFDVGAEDETNALGLIRSLLTYNFRLDGGAPYSFCLLRGKKVNYLVFSCHPALIDQFSLKLLFTAISDVYGNKTIADELGLSQPQLLAVEQELLSRPQKQESVRFWLQLAKETSFEWRPPRLEGALTENFFTANLSAADREELATLADELEMGTEELTLFCFHLFLHRLTRNEAIVTSHYHRISTSPLDLIGFNENKPIVKSAFDTNISVRRYFKLQKKLFRQTQFHSDLPAREMTRELRRIIPDFERPTNILFTKDHLPYEELKLAGVQVTLLPFFSHRLEREDLAVYFGAQNSHFHVITRSPQQTATVKLAFDHFLALLQNIRTQVDRPLREISLFSEPLTRRAMSFSEGGKLKKEATDVILAFRDQVQKNPEAIAVTDKDGSITYQELNRTAALVGAGLKLFCAGKNEPLVGLSLPRNRSMIQGIFGTFFAGAAYLPLDSKMPAERLAFIAGDANLAAVIVDRETKELMQGLVHCPVISIEDLLAASPANADLEELPKGVTALQPAYVIYTSGTTGKPKGVLLERKALAHFMASLEGIWDRGAGNRWLQFASFNFDASVLEIFPPLTQGGELVIAPLEVRADPEALMSFIQEKRVTHACIPPAMMPLLPRQQIVDLKAIFCGGEVIDEEAARFWSKVLDLGNCYGPTEASVMCTFNRLRGYKSTSQLGRPLRGYQTFLLDEMGQLAPLGGVGEICIGGEALARGYLGRPELTEQKFIPNRFGKGRLYRTGDLARFLANGDLEFLGRNDFQVKIRGFRIEIGDIESAITEQPEVRGAYVAVTDGGAGKVLTAWYASTHFKPEQLRKRLADRLPHYMVPSFLVRMNSLPVNVNGKIDRTRLPAPELTPQGQVEDAMDAFELKVREVWAAVLKIDAHSIGPESQFFLLGGHSLLAALVCSRLNKTLELTVRPKTLFEYPLFADFCLQLRGLPKEAPELPPLLETHQLASPVENRLTELIYSRAALYPDDNMYNIVMRVDFTKPLDPKLLQKIVSDFLKDNPIFRAYFHEKGSRIWVDTLKEVPTQVALRPGSEDDCRQRLEAYRRESLGVHQAPLWRAEIIQMEQQSSLLFCIHHLLFDGWSLNLMIEELQARYQAASSQKKFISTRLTWFDYCQWSQGLSKTAPFQRALQYWRHKLGTANAQVHLPATSFQKVDNSNQSYNIHIPADVVALLQRFADERGLTLPPVFFSLYLIWIWRLSNQRDLVCGYPYAGRDISGSEDIFGTFVVMGYLRQILVTDQSFAELAQSVHKQMLDDKEHLIAAPYDAEISGMDSLNVIFSLQSGIGLRGPFGNGSFQAEEEPSMTSKGDIAGIFYQDLGGAILGRMEFDASLFEPEMLKRFAGYFPYIALSAAQAPQKKISDLNYQSDTETAQILEMSSSPLSQVTEGSSICDHFSQIAKRDPQATALIFGEKILTYGDLEIWSNQVANSLPELPPESFVGLSLKKGFELIVGILAILKRGYAYVPLDSSYPAQRLQFFAADSGLNHVLVDVASQQTLIAAGLKEISYHQVVPLDEQIAKRLKPVNPESLAYLIYTSGSTGTPKGVLIEHQSVVKMIMAVANEFKIGPGNTQTLLASMNFDASVLETFVALLSGASLLVVSEEDRKDPEKVHAVLEKNKVSHCLTTPAILQALPQKVLPQLKYLGYGGDVLDAAASRFWSQATELFSLYGPTETTVAATMGRVLPQSSSRLIGRPLPGYRVYLLNSERQAVPFGAIGEICIGGEGAARGYLRREDLTIEKFILDPFASSPYSTMYLTGDLGRFLPDGSIEFIGRNDDQIKLRGYRIELGEIETQLSRIPGVQQVVCAIKGTDPNKYLAAYYVSERPLEDELIRKELLKFLPEYMVPSFFVAMKELPVTPGGKLDRKSLPAVTGKVSKNPPHPGLEQKIAEIWEEVLSFRGMDRDENFFHIGGNSLLVVRMQAELQRRLEVEFAIADFYSLPTIEGLASGKSQNSIALAIADANQELQFQAVNPASLSPAEPQVILLTGANGFLGIFLLAELTQKGKIVHCLLRAKDEAAGLQALKKQATEAGLQIDFALVNVLLGNLSEPRLGVSTEKWLSLGKELDGIIHCAAFVHHLHSYSMMKSANVLGTLELLKLAVEQKLKSFCFVSTLTVGAALSGIEAIYEKILPNPPVADNGYILTKWVGEQLAQRCAEKYGLPVVIARPGNITGSTQTGFTNFANNHFWLFNKGCLQLGVYPDLPVQIEMMPVNILAAAIAGLSLTQRQGSLVANLSNPKTIPQSEFFTGISACGFPVRRAPGKEWQALLTNLPEDNGLSTIRGFYLGELSGDLPPIAREKLLAALKKCEVSIEADEKSLIPIYIGYLKKTGFLQH